MNTLKDVVLAAVLYPLCIFGVGWLARHLMGFQFTDNEIFLAAFSCATGHSIRGWWERRQQNAEVPEV